MRRIKAYKDFQLVNESLGFSNSEEYRLLKEKSNNLSKEYFQEHFYDITDENLVDFSYWSYIGTDKGYIRDTVDYTKDHYVYYGVSLKPKGDILDRSSVDSIDSLKQISSDINKVVSSVESFKSRILQDGLEVTSISIPRGVTPSMRAITMTIRGAKISTSDLEEHYGKWKSKKGPNYDEGIRKIKEWYSEKGIPNVELDTNEDMDDSGDIIHIGFMMIESEIISVATYSRKTDTFTIDWPEIRRSVTEYFIEVNGH